MNNTSFFPFERNRYFYGKLLTVRDFEVEQRYHSGKRALLNRTFLGRYSNYFLHFADGMCVPDQPSIEFSQDLGHTQTLYQPGDHLTLRPNPDKINVFTADMEKSLLKDVIRYEQA